MSAATQTEGYAEFAARLFAGGGIGDAWIDGQPRFETEPLVLDRTTHARMCAAAEAVAETIDEAIHLLAAHPSWLEDLVSLSPAQGALWESAAPFWHGFARADVFLRPDGEPIVCEVNCDTPSGQSEAIALGRLAAATRPTVSDPNARLLPALLALFGRFLESLDRPDPGAPPAIGIVYPTELTEDLALIELYRAALEAGGARVVLGAPFNLHVHGSDGVGLFGTRIDLVLRHYKTDWWTERAPIWSDEAPYPDPEPLLRPLRVLLRAERARQCAVVNPWGSIIAQNKRLYAFLWERTSDLSARAQAAVRSYVPETHRLERLDRVRLSAERAEWVLKSDYGCEGDEVLVGACLPQAEWDEAIARALPRRWIAQRHFEATRDARGREANHGVYLVAGRAAGLYTRLSIGPTDASALSVAALVTS